MVLVPEIVRQPAEIQIESYLLNDDGVIPNNPNLPLLLYRDAFRTNRSDLPADIEDMLNGNDWCGCWRNGIYHYHHYHSTAHETLVVYRGSATVRFGGEKGITAEIKTGDAIVIPAGVGHKNTASTDDFGVIGAYPCGQSWDVCYGKAAERPDADKNISSVPLPKADPVFGADGPLMDLWTA
jgi:uncharacterized protein YjlB